MNIVKMSGLQPTSNTSNIQNNFFSETLMRRDSSSSRVFRHKENTHVVSSKMSLFKEYGGLGMRFYDRLGDELDKIFQVDVNTTQTETKGSVRRRSVQLALEMRARGVVPKDIIVICSRNNADQVIVLLASLFIGAIVAPLDPEYSNREKEKLLKKLKPKMCFGGTRTIIHLDRILHTLNHNTELFNFSNEHSSEDIIPFSKLFTYKEEERFLPIYIEDTRRTVAFILPTQGTTGTPKLVCVSHDSICVQCSIFEDIFHFPNRIISFFPLSWILQIILTCVCLDSLTTLILPGEFIEKTACKIIHDFDIGSAILGTDYAMKLCQSVAVRDYNIKCLKSVMVGIVDTSKYDIKMLKKFLPEVKFLPIYCMVETGCIAATRSKYYQVSLTKPADAVGTLTLNCKIKVVNIKTKELCGPDTYGEINFSGDGLMLGYYKDRERNLLIQEKGYFRTGDLGKFDEDGWLYVSGRIEDLIQFDNWSLLPTELEDIITSYRYVKDCVVVGDEKDVIVMVKKYPDKELSIPELQNFIAEKMPQKYWPSKIILLEHFPRTTIGSVKKRVLRQEHLDVNIMYSSSMSMVPTQAESSPS